MDRACSRAAWAARARSNGLGSVGVIYRLFSLSMATSILFSAFLALTLTPALCATLLKPIAKGEHHEKRGFFGWFNRRFEQLTERYQGWVAYALKRMRNGHSQTEIARKLGITYQSYQKLENPRKCNPTVKTLERIGEVLGKELVISWR